MGLSGAWRLVASSVQDLVALPVLWDDKPPFGKGSAACSRANDVLPYGQTSTLPHRPRVHSRHFARATPAGCWCLRRTQRT